MSRKRQENMTENDRNNWQNKEQKPYFCQSFQNQEKIKFFLDKYRPHTSGKKIHQSQLIAWNIRNLPMNT